MDCEHALILISAALDGEITPAEQLLLEEHLEHCPECRELADDIGVISVALSDMEVLPPPDLASRVMDTISEKKKVLPFPGQSWKRWGALAAALAVVISLGVFSQFNKFMGSDHANSSSANQPAGGAETSADSDSGPSKEASLEAGSSQPQLTSGDGAAPPVTEEIKETPAQEMQNESISAKTGTTNANDTADEPMDAPAEAGTPYGNTGVQPNQTPPESENSAGQGDTDGPNADVPQMPMMAAAPAPSETPESVESDQSIAPFSGMDSSNPTGPSEPMPLPDTRMVEVPESVPEDSVAPVAAIEQVFAYLGGTETYPDAVYVETEGRYALSSGEDGLRTWQTFLEYMGLSPDGLYYEFQTVTYYEENSDFGTISSSEILENYSVSLDGASFLHEGEPITDGT